MKKEIDRALAYVSEIEEIRESEKTGYIGDLVREYARKTGEITGGLSTTDFYMVQINLFKEASFRWLNS